MPTPWFASVARSLWFCSMADSDGAVTVAEAIREAISQLALPEAARLERLTASIGAASYPEHGDHLDELLAAADRAMYAAKHGGRNRVLRAPARLEVANPRRAG
jgi:diguanylate cyclase (GGDEF)-like protein